MAFTSLTDIGNGALDLLDAGTVQDIENPTSATEELLNRWVDHARKLCLRQHPWNFAAKRANLAANITAPLFGYTASFTVPGDFIRVLSINDSDFSFDNIPTNYYGFEGNNLLVGEGIYSSGSVLKLVYVSDFQDIPRMDPMFIDLWIHEVALLIAFKATKSNGDVQRLETLKDSRRSLAMAIDGQERPPRRVQRSRNINSRMSGNQAPHRIIF